MGSNAAPDVIKPSRIIDFLRLDGAQVTRPSIDPLQGKYRFKYIIIKRKN